MATARQFPPQIRQTVDAFAASMQLSGVPKPAQDGGYSFVFEHSGVLSLLPSSDGREVVMALGRRPVSDDEDSTRRFLLQASLEAMTSGPLHAALTGNGMFCYATRIPVDEFDLPTLEANLKGLAAAHEAAQ